MKKTATLLLLLFCTHFTIHAQSKKDLEATIAQLTTRNDSLTKVTQGYAKLVDSLNVMTGVNVQDLDTVKHVLTARASQRTISADSLTKVNSRNALLRIQVDSLTRQVTRLRTDSTAMAAQLVSAVAAQGPGGAAPAMSKTDQMMKLNGMMEQGLITKEEFLKLKQEMMGK